MVKCKDISVILLLLFKLQAQDYEDALHWFNYSLEIYESDKTDLDVARLQRNMASCYMRLNQYEKVL